MSGGKFGNDKLDTNPEFSNSENNDLLCCPFCGASGDVWEEDRGQSNLDEVWVVGCTTCPAELEGIRNSNPSKHFPDEKQKTIDAWNTRAT